MSYKLQLSQTNNDVSEEKSVLFIKNLLVGNGAAVRIGTLEKTPNIDGYIEPLDKR